MQFIFKLANTHYRPYQRSRSFSYSHLHCKLRHVLLFTALYFGPYLLKVIKHVSSKKCIFNENLKNNMQYPYQIYFVFT